MKMRLIFYHVSLFILLISCCLGVKETHLGNNIYLSEYDNVDCRILYQTKSCATSGVEIVPMTVLEMGYNDKWILAKTGNGKKRTDMEYFKFYVIKNIYEKIPNSETIKKNTNEFINRKDFDDFLIKNRIGLKLNKID